MTKIESKTDKIILLFFGFVAIFLSFLWIDKYPLVWADEVSYSQPAWTFIKEGHFGYFIPLFGLDKTIVVFGRIHLLLCALVFKLFSYPNIYAVRFVMFLGGVIAAIVLYFLAKRLYDSKVALYSAFFFAISPNFFWSFRCGRPELLLTCLFLISFFLFLIALEKDSSKFYFFAGLVSALSCDVHLNGLAFPVILVLLYFIFKRAEIFKKNFLALVAGIFCGFIYWFLVHIIIPTPRLFFYQWNNFFQGMQRRISLNPIKMFLLEFQRYKGFFWEYKYHRNMPLIFFILFGIFGALKRKTFGDKVILYSLLIYCLFLMFFVTNKTSFYFTCAIPLFSVLVARSQSVLPSKVIRNFIIFSFIGYYFLQILGYIYFFPREEFHGYMDEVRSVIPQKAVVFGEPIHWLGFYQHRFYAQDGSYYLEKEFSNVIEEYGVDYLILGDCFRYTLERNRVLKEDVDSFLRERGQLLRKIENRFYQRQLGYTGLQAVTEVYRINNGSP